MSLQISMKVMGSALTGYVDSARRTFHAAASLCYLARIHGSMRGGSHGSAVSLYEGFSRHVDACAQTERKLGLEDCPAVFLKEFVRGTIDASYGTISGRELFERLQAQDMARKTGGASGRCTECGRECKLELSMRPNGSVAWNVNLRI